MKCYYESLGVARDASEADIKTAYRKMALRWHPDKNLDCAEDAKEKFQLIQQAYEVLSDSHERAWYDNHREQILRGKNSEYEENCLDLFQYFTVSCYRGYGDDEKGFYRIYAEVFEKIAAEDAEFMEDEDDVAEIPKFGDSCSNYDEVVNAFYAYWQSYCTKKTYTWLCPYDIQEIKDRRVLREVEKELKKIVQKAKKERNEEVRNLVSFVRRRDRRVQANKKLLEERATLNRQKQEQLRLEQIQKRNKDIEEMRQNRSQTFNEEYEEQLKQLEQHYGGDSSDLESDEYDAEEEEDEQLNGDIEALNVDDEADYVDDLYCVACNKSFKNENAFANHETSKKHRENVERLRQEMIEEENVYGEGVSEEASADENEAEEYDDDYDVDDDEKKVLNAATKKQQKEDDSSAELAENDTDSELLLKEEPQSETQTKSKKDKNSKKTNKAKKTTQLVESDAEEELEQTTKVGDNSDTDDDNWASSSKKNTKKPKAKQSKKHSALAKGAQKESASLPEPKVAHPPPAVSTDGESADATTHVCVTCKATFESKNKLFAHLKKTNHGVYIPKTKAEPVETGKKNKGRRK